MISSIFDKDTLKEVKKKMREELSAERYNIFIDKLELKSVSEDKIDLLTQRHSDILILEKYYKNTLEAIISDITHYHFEVAFSVNNEMDTDKHKENNQTVNLNPKFNFEEYVESSCNVLAVRAAKSIADYANNISSDNKNNPGDIKLCFIYGGVGLGKTHLLQAIGNYVKNANTNMNVIYVTSEQFVGEYVNSINNKSLPVFQHKYRSCDLLLIDDIQFLKNKDGTQEELFNTFNHLYNNHKRIVFTSDKKPNDLGGIEERLKSRFAWGLTTDIQPPNFETRLAIIDKKLEKVKVAVPKEVRIKIANAMKNNIRELEGCLNTLVQTCILTGAEADMKHAEDIINRITNESNTKKISIFDVKSVVADFYRVSIDDLDKKKRTKEIAHARQVAMYLARNITDTSLPKLGQDFGGRDHSTVSSAIKKIEEQRKIDEKLANDLKLITDELQG